MKGLAASDDFNKEVLQASKLQPVLVFFTAPWCGYPCREQRKILNEVETSNYAMSWKFVEINVEDHPEWIAKYKVQSIPQTMFFRHAEKIDGVVGVAKMAYVVRCMTNIAPPPTTE